MSQATPTLATSQSLFPNFTLYAFTLQLALGERRDLLPAYLGSTIRGIFAASLRCAGGCQEAETAVPAALLQSAPTEIASRGYGGHDRFPWSSGTVLRLGAYVQSGRERRLG